METLLALLTLAALGALVVGVVYPRAVVPWRSEPTRRFAAALYGAVFVGCFILIGVFVEVEPTEAERADVVVTLDDQMGEYLAAAERGAHRRARNLATSMLERFPDSVAVQNLEEDLVRLDSLVAYHDSVEGERAEARDEERRQQAEEQRQLALERKWTYRTSEDQMTGRTNQFATISSENTVEFDFPYQGAQHARLVLRDRPGQDRSAYLTIERGQFLCNNFDRCDVRIRFDEGQPTTWQGAAPTDHSTTTIFLRNYDTFLSRLQSAEVVRIQPNVYQHSGVIFEFHVGGFQADQYR